ncbi:MAG TPA: VWA domain-containing protein [Candidatus Coproplasma excrementipullorum]|nr:VWA domain-containing protein [Candidatus Coproplasma excrementipullorum]
MSNISFDNVYLLFLIIPLAALIVVPFVLAVRRENANGHNIASCVIHLLIALLVCFAIAGTTVVSVITQTEVYVVADVSYSANRNLNTVDEYIQNVRRALPANSRMGVVVFGKDCEVLTELGGEVVSVRNSRVDDSETDITGALSYTSELFSDGVIKRIVIITDGKETDSQAYGELAGTINTLYDSNIYVDAIYVDDNIPENTPEVQISSVDFNSTAYFGRPAAADVIIQSGMGAEGSAVHAILNVEVSPAGANNWSAYGNGYAIDLYRGSNAFTFDLNTTIAGAFDYRLTITAEEDTDATNNVYTFTQTVVEDIQVLLVASNISQVNQIRALYDAEHTEIDYYILPAQGASVPCVVEDLYVYDEIVLSDINLLDIPNYASFVDAVDTVVSAFGKSLLTFGNLYLQNSSDEVFSQLGDMLPVRYGGADQDSRLITFVLDNSRSLIDAGKLTRLKSAVSQIISELLTDDDYVAIVTFNGDVEWVQSTPMLLGGTTNGRSNRDIIQEEIDAITYRQGTNISAGLRAAQEMLAEQTSNFANSQIWLMSDGADFSGNATDPASVADELYDMGVYTSCIYVGPDLSDYASEMDTMRSIAEAGCGYADDNNFYICNNDEALEDLMLGSLSDTFTGTIVDEQTHVNIGISADEAVSGFYSVPDVGGYYYSRIKNSAQTVLTADYSIGSGGATMEVPLYAWWNYGSGRVASFTSSFDSTYNWMNGWTDDNGGLQVLRNILTSNTPEERVDYAFTFGMEYSEGYLSFNVIPEVLSTSATATVEIIMPDGVQVVTGSMIFDSQSYSYSYMLSATGKYTIKVTYASGDSTYEVNTSYTLSYLPEHNAFASYDAATLNRLLSGRGVVSEDGTIAIVNPEDELATYEVNLTMPLLIAAAAFFVVDIIIRKLKWVDVKNLFVKIK